LEPFNRRRRGAPDMSDATKIVIGTLAASILLALALVVVLAL
jgi:hypothetical protein